jgi:DNA (cytosine-5)-methyltransferase 1
MGYHLAGFEVVGVDIKPQPNYPFKFIQGDALKYLAAHGHEFDAIHASPPCQVHSAMTRFSSTKEHIDLIPQTRELLQQSGKPYIIENVPGSPLINPVTLCGTEFGLGVARHRLFESNVPLTGHGKCNHAGQQLYTVLTRSCRKIGDMRGPSSHDIGKKAMDVGWMTQFELGLSIPPAYTKFLGEQMKQHLVT